MQLGLQLMKKITPVAYQCSLWSSQRVTELTTYYLGLAGLFGVFAKQLVSKENIFSGSFDAYSSCDIVSYLFALTMRSVHRLLACVYRCLCISSPVLRHWCSALLLDLLGGFHFRSEPRNVRSIRHSCSLRVILIKKSPQGLVTHLINVS